LHFFRIVAEGVLGTLRQRNEFAPKLQYWFRSAQHWTDDLGSTPKNEKQR
jgi:hypothetical protein